jgi:MoaA/NifB/PqqE/SkfB family radical SAM enzyme
MPDLTDAKAAYDAYRGAQPGDRFCDAPSVNMHFGPGGFVFACCFNQSYALGSYPAQSVADIWNGPKAQALRQAIARLDFSKGCQKCEQQLVARDFVGLYPQQYRDVARRGAGKAGIPGGPVKLEFNLHNACNLECVMCHGFSSSLIRRRREALPVITSPYDERFVEQLTPFLPGVLEAGFAGGEPFLVPVNYRLWERIADHHPETIVLIVTNGTIVNDRVRELAERLTCVINVSVDSIVKDTYEAIRKNSSLDLVLENSRYFAGLMQRKGFPFIWRCCVMRQNWREMPDMIRYCDDHGIRVIFNQVERPLNFSLHTLPPADLREVVRVLEQADTFDARTPVQAFNHEQYRGLVGRLAGYLTPANRRNGLLTRLETVQPIADMTIVSLEGRQTAPFAREAARRLTGAAASWVGSRLCIDQAAADLGADAIPPAAREIQTAWEGELTRLRQQLPAEEFLEILLGTIVRAYVDVWGVEPGHDAAFFDRVPPVARRMAGEPASREIIDHLIASPPARIYREIAGSDAPQFAWLRPAHLGDAGAAPTA